MKTENNDKEGSFLYPTTYEQAALFEHRFWLQILGDHSRFILNALAPKEAQAIQMANTFVQTFDQLLATAQQPLTRSQIVALTQEAATHAQRLREFKLTLLTQQLAAKITINLTPTFINHMVNELEEYLRVLTYLLSQTIPPVFHPVHHHLLWLLDGYGHATAIGSSLDAVEKRLIDQAHTFSVHFEDYYRKAVEMVGYMRTSLTDFPALRRFNREAEAEMLFFMDFLTELEQLVLTNQALSEIAPLMPDHMLREECYYLTKLARSASNVASPNCDPTRPRVEG